MFVCNAPIGQYQSIYFMSTFWHEVYTINNEKYYNNVCVYKVLQLVYWPMTSAYQYPSALVSGNLLGLLGDGQQMHIFLITLTHTQASSPGDNTTRTSIPTSKYIQVVIYDHITRRKA